MSLICVLVALKIEPVFQGPRRRGLSLKICLYTFHIGNNFDFSLHLQKNLIKLNFNVSGVHWFEICHHLKIFSDHLSVTIWNYFISHISCFNLKSFHTTNQSPYEKLSNRNSFWEAFINFQTTYQSPLEKLSNGDHSDGDDQRGITSLQNIHEYIRLLHN